MRVLFSLSRITRVSQLIFMLSLFLYLGSAYAQDATAEPLPQITEVVSDVSEENSSAESTPFVESTPFATQEVSPTPLPTQETSIILEDPTLEATQDTAPVPTDIVAPPTEDTSSAVPDTSLPLSFYASFDTGYPTELSANTGWVEVALTQGAGLQANPGALPVTYVAATFSDAAVEARFLLNTGEGQIMLRGYAAGLAANGTVTLYRNQTVVVSSSAFLTQSEWALLRLEIVGSQVKVSVNETPILVYEDTAVPSGLTGFAANSDAVLRVDDFAVYGIPTSTIPIVPVITPTEEIAPAEIAAAEMNTMLLLAGSPANASAEASGLSVIITWTDDGTPGTYYEIQRYIDEDEVGLIGTTAANAESFTESNVGCGITLWYRVRAVSAGGIPGEWSAWLKVDMPLCDIPVCDPAALVQRVAPVAYSQTRGEGMYQLTGMQPPVGRAITNDGRFVIFSSTNPFLDNTVENGPGVRDVFLYGFESCSILRQISTGTISVGTPSLEPAYAGPILDLYDPGNNASAGLFVSSENNLAEPLYPTEEMDVDNASDVFIHYGRSITELRSLEDGGQSSLEGNVFVVNSDPKGQGILMQMSAPVPGITDTNLVQDLVMYDRFQNLMVISANTTNTATGNGPSFGGDVVASPDGSSFYVVFNSQATDLGGIANPTCTLSAGEMHCTEVYVRNISAGTTTRISIGDDDTTLPNRSAFVTDAVIWNNTLYVLFQSTTTNFGDSSGQTSLYLRSVPLSNLAVGTTTLVAISAYDGQLSGTAQIIAFNSDSALIPADTNAVTDVYVRDLGTNNTQRVSLTLSGQQLTEPSSIVEMNQTGERIVFRSTASNIVLGDTADVCEVDHVGTPDYNENCADLFVAVNPISLLPTPANFTASTNDPEELLLSWSDVAGESSYYLEYEIPFSDDWWEFYGTGANQTSTSVWVGCGQIYRLRLYSVRQTPFPGRSQPAEAVGQTAPCPAPDVYQPIGFVNEQQPTFEWELLNRHADDMYELDISTVSTFASHVAGFPRQVNDTRNNSAVLPDGTYYWRVRPIAANPLTDTWDAAGPYSTTESFIIDTTPPAVPAFTAPANNATVSSARPTLTWTAVTDAARYILSFSNADHSYTGYEQDLTTTSYTPTQDLPSGTYSAQIQAVDAAGNVSATQGEVQFIVSLAQINGFTWVRASSQPRNNGQAQGIVLNGRLYSFGGYAPCCTPSALSYSYDPKEDVWMPIADMPAPVVKAGIATDGQFIYIAGGYLKRPTGGQYYGTTNVWRYDPVANTYGAITPLPVANSTGQLVYVNNELHYIGGTTANTRAQDLDTHWVLDLSVANAGWVSESPLPVPRHHGAAVVIGTTIYYIGGQKGHDANLIPQNAVHSYDTVTNTWMTLAPMPGLGRNHMSHSVIVINGKIYVFGGQTNEDQVVDNITEYDPATNTWREAGTLFAPRGSAIVGLIDGVVYFATGDSAATYKGYYTPQPLKIENFTLIDTAKDYPIAVIREESTINLTDQPTALSIGVVFSGWPLGSVVMGWNANPRYRVENSAPFAFYDNSATNYTSGPIPVGANTITATPYSGPNGTGTAGTPLTIHFTVLANANKVPKITNPGTQYSWVGKPITPLQIVVTDPNGDTVTYSATGLPPGLSLNTTTGVISGTPKPSSVLGPRTYTVELQVKEIRTYPFTTQTSFQWVVYPEELKVTQIAMYDAATNNKIGFTNQGTWNWNLGNQPVQPVNVVAEVSYQPYIVDRVEFRYSYNGGANKTRVDSTAPYTLFDPAAPEGLQAGSYRITVTPYHNNGGPAGVARTFIRTVINNWKPVFGAMPDQTHPVNAPIPPVQINVTDPEGQPITLEISNLPPGLSMSPTGLITGTPIQAGFYEASVFAYDPYGYEDIYGKSLTHINFYITSADIITVTKLQLIDAETDQVIMDLNDGMTVNLFPYNGLINIAAVTQNEPILAVEFYLQHGSDYELHNDWSRPFALYATNGMDYTPGIPPLNEPLTITATPYTGTGITGIPKTVTVTFIYDNGCTAEEEENGECTMVQPGHMPTISHQGFWTATKGLPTQTWLYGEDLDGDPLIYEISGLPAGLTLDASTGRISGIPTVSGFYQSTATVRDSKGYNASIDINWHIQG